MCVSFSVMLILNAYDLILMFNIIINIHIEDPPYVLP